MKPRRQNPDHTPRSANEKICADLANDLSLNVPPALLYDRQDAEDDEETHTVLSLYVADRVWRLKDIKDLPDPPWDLVDEALQAASGIVALDTWIGNSDRNNDRNVLFIERQDIAEDRWAVFIDFAYTLNRNNQWDGGDGTEVDLPNLPDRLEANVDVDALEEAVTAIEDLSEDEIRRVTDRIPPEYMDDDHRELVAESLRDRAGSVREALQPHFGLGERP